MAQNSISIVIQAQDNASKQLAAVNTGVKRLGGGFKSFAADASRSFGTAADKIAGFAKAATGFFIGGAIGLGNFIKQASQLQSMKASFESMTGSAKTAEAVLKQLYKFSFKTAFSTEQINKAAQLLLGAGLRVKDLGRYMQAIGDVAGATGADLGQLTLPLSQALARGKLQTQDFYQILNSGAGKLGQALREELAKRGMGDLQTALEKGQVTSELLFSVIQKSAKKGGFAFQGAIKQAQTFNGRMSNLQETIGNVALKVLGVDKATGAIDPNGVFAKLSKAVLDATNWLTKNQDAVKGVAKVIIDNAIPAVTGIAAAYTGAKLAAIGFKIAALDGDALLRRTIIGGVITLISALAFLQVKFNIFGKAWQWIKSRWSDASDFFANIFGTIKDSFDNIGKWFKDRFGEAKRAVKDFFDGFKGWVDDSKGWIIGIGTALTLFFLPSIVRVTAQVVASGLQIATAGATASGAWIVGAAKTSLAWLVNLPKVVAGFIVTSAQSTIHAAIVSARWIASAVATAFAWAVTTTQSIIASFSKIAAAAVAQSIVSKGAWVGAAATSRAAFMSFAALMATPIAFPAIIIGAALASIWAVVSAYKSAKAALDQQDAAGKNDLKASIDLMNLAKRQYKAGKISNKEFHRLVGIAARAKGGPVEAGKPYIVGENSPELFVPNQSGRILNQQQMRDSGIGGGQQINVTNHIYNQVDQEAFLRDLGWRLRTAA